MIKELTRFENILFQTGAVMMLVALVGRLWNAEVGMWLYGIGTLLFCLMQVRMEYMGRDIVLKRLRRQQLLSCVFFLLTLFCMSMQVYQYGIATRNEWMVTLAIACILQLYTAWRIPSEIKKMKKS